MESGHTVYNTVVVGAGIEGSATAYYLAKNGKRTVLLEQFSLPHTKGSSHGQSRATEHSFGQNDFYIPLTIEANKMIDELQTECGEQLFINCGWFTFGPKGEPFLSGTESGLKKYGIPYDKFDVEEQRRRYPNLSLPDDFEFVLDKRGGLHKADRMLLAFQSQFVRYGGILKDNEAVTDISMGEIVLVKTHKGVYKAKSIVLTLGPWATKLLPKVGVNIPLEVEAVAVSYWKDINKDFSIDNVPVFFTMAAAGEHWFGCTPAYEFPGLVKLVLPTGKVTDPDNREATETDEALKILEQIVASHFPTLEKKPSRVESSVITNTPDHDYVLDVHPVWKNVVIGTGFSGYGFKLSPVVGKILGQLASGQQPSYDISRFKMDRFLKKPKP